MNSPKMFQLNLSTLRSWLPLLALIWLLGTIGLGWLVKSFLVIIGIILIAPLIIMFGAQWWLKRNWIQDSCPVCNYEFTGFQRTQFECPSCGETLKAEKGQFQRLTPPGTIDVEAVEVS